MLLSFLYFTITSDPLSATGGYNDWSLSAEQVEEAQKKIDDNNKLKFGRIRGDLGPVLDSRD
jgi:hypothetical protein